MKRVPTVLGDIPADELGVTMPHEHVICDISLHSGHAYNRLTDVEAAAREVAAFRLAGGCTIVDVTTPDIGRDPAALKRVSELSGVNIVTCTGYYAEAVYPSDLMRKSVDELAGEMIAEVRDGIGETGVRPGIIGELGAKGFDLTPAEERVLRAAARTHLETGLAITLHSTIGRPAPNQVAVLREEGVPTQRVIVGHADVVWHDDVDLDLAYFLPLLDAGCFLEFDTVGWPENSPDAARVERIRLLLDRGYERQLLLSTDLCRVTFYRANGGRGYDCVLRDFAPMLREAGVTDDQMRLMLKENPREALSLS